MRLHASALAAAVLFAALAIPAVRAGDDKKPCAEADVPKPAVDTLHKKFPTAKVTGWVKEEEDGKTFYAAKTEWSEKDKDGKETAHKVDVDVSAEGKILEEEEVVAAETLPAAVTKAIAASTHAKAKITRVERKIVGEKADAPIYEVLFTEDGKSAEVEFDASGKVLEEEADEHDEKDGKKDGDKKDAGMDDKGAMGA